MAPFLSSSDSYLRQRALLTLIAMKSKEAVPTLIKLLHHDRPRERHYALTGLVKVDGRSAAPHIAKLVRDEEGDIRFLAVDTLVKLEAKEHAESLFHLVNSDQAWNVEIYAIAALIKFDEHSVIPLAVNRSISADLSTRSEMLNRITGMNLKSVVPQLERVLASSDILGGDTGTNSKYSLRYYKDARLFEREKLSADTNLVP